MGNRNVKIGNLRLRLPRSAAGRAHQIAAELGRAILQTAAETTRRRQGIMQVTEINTGRIDVAGGRDPLTQKQQICGRVAAELRKRFG